MLKAINLTTRQINVAQYPETIAAARIVWIEECRAKAAANNKDTAYWDKALADAQKEAERVQADPEMVTWIRAQRTFPGRPSLADRIMAKPMGDQTVNF